MITSPAGRKLIEQFEGLRLNSYRDAIGVWTIGFGHTSMAGLPKVVPGMRITMQEADDILAADLGSFELVVNEAVKVPLTQNQFDALVSLVFNIGGSNFRKSSLLRYLNKGNYSEAAARFSQWTKAGGNVLLALARRRKAEAALFRK